MLRFSIEWVACGYVSDCQARFIVSKILPRSSVLSFSIVQVKATSSLHGRTLKRVGFALKESREHVLQTIIRRMNGRIRPSQTTDLCTHFRASTWSGIRSRHLSFQSDEGWRKSDRDYERQLATPHNGIGQDTFPSLPLLNIWHIECEKEKK